jgi:CheY-like chemotaxis protein
VLLDIKMPRVDGIEVLRRVKSDPQLRVVPVVMLTSSREERDVVQSYQLNANGYVVKPVAFEEFTSVVNGLGSFWAKINEPPWTDHSRGK